MSLARKNNRLTRTEVSVRDRTDEKRCFSLRFVGLNIRIRCVVGIAISGLSVIVRKNNGKDCINSFYFLRISHYVYGFGIHMAALY